MAKLTVKQLYYGDEYGVMGEVIKPLLQNPPPTVTIDPIAYREVEIVRQTLIAVEKMKKNGDCIAEVSRQCGHRFCMKGERKWITES